MAGKRRPNNPAGGKPDDKVQQLQDRLRDAAKQHPERRFHALFDRLCRSDVLQAAWKRVKRNGGAAGVDGVTLEAIVECGEQRFLDELAADLHAKRYRPQAVLRRYIPKADGKKRPLGIPTVRDRVVQAAAKLLLEPIFEVDFRKCSYGFRPGRNATQALDVWEQRCGSRGSGTAREDRLLASQAGTTSREDEERRSLTRHRELRLSRLHSAETHVRADLGTRQEACLLPAASPIETEHGAHSGPDP
jgi:hypothetical protein